MRGERGSVCEREERERGKRECVRKRGERVCVSV